MIKKNIFFLLFSMNFCILNNYISASKNKIFIELDNVLFHIKENKLTPSIFKSLVDNYIDIDGYREELFNYLKECTIEKNDLKDLLNTQVFYKSKEMPELVKGYFLGILNSDQAKKKALKIVDDKISWWSSKRFAFKQAIEILFTPEKAASIMEPNQEIVNFLTLCLKNKNNILYLVTNKSAKTVSILKEKYPEVFELFNGGCIVSSEVNSLKPSIDFFKYIIKEDSFDNCFAIESENKHKETLSNLGINSILYNYNTNINTINELTNNFKQLNLLD